MSAWVNSEGVVCERCPPPPPPKRLFAVGNAKVTVIGLSDKAGAAAAERLSKMDGAKAYVLEGTYDAEKLARSYHTMFEREHLAETFYYASIDAVTGCTSWSQTMKWVPVVG